MTSSYLRSLEIAHVLCKRYRELEEGTNSLTVPGVPGLHYLLQDRQKRLWRALLCGGEQQTHIVHCESELRRGCRDVNQSPQARPLEGIDRMLALPLRYCRPTNHFSFLSLAVSPSDPCTLGGDDAGVSPFSLRHRTCYHASHGFDLPASPEHQREKMETTTRNQFSIADLLTSRQRCP